jgi:hypothetical protein
MTSTWFKASVAGAYLALWTHAFYGSGLETAPVWSFGHPWLAILGSNILLGILVSRWWAALLPFVLVGLAVPLSDWNCGDGLECIGEPLAIWMFFGVLLVAVPCVGVGMLIRRSADAQVEGDQNSSRLPSGS